MHACLYTLILLEVNWKDFFAFQVGYATALDVFIVLCFVMVFGALIEFAFLNFLDTLVRRLKKKDAERRNLAKLLMENKVHHTIGEGLISGLLLASGGTGAGGGLVPGLATNILQFSFLGCFLYRILAEFCHG